MLAFLLKIGIGSIASKLADAYKARENARTDQERIAAEERIAMLQAQASTQRPIDAFIRVLFALPVAIYFGKLYLFDKVLGLGSTDALSPELDKIAMVIIGFYFIHSMFK